MEKRTIQAAVSVALAAAVFVTTTRGVASADAITDLGNKVDSTIVTPTKTAFILIGGGLGVSALILAGILAAMSNKMWKSIFIGGLICLLLVVFGPVLATVITGLGTTG